MQWLNITGRYHSLVAAVIECAVNDLRGTDPRCGRFERDRAMAFILSDGCEAYCLELGVDVETVREKAAELYRLLIEKECPGPDNGNRLKTPSQAAMRILIRQSPGKLNRRTYRQVVGHFKEWPGV